jgi:hypothetical protein
MFTPPIVKPKAKTTSNVISQFGRDRPFEWQRDSGDVKQAPSNPEHDAGPAGMSAKGGPPGRSWNFCQVPAYSAGREQPFQMPPLDSAPRFPVQAKFKVGAVDDAPGGPPGPSAVDMFYGNGGAVQEAAAAEDPARIHEAAAAGTSGSSGPLPFLDQIQKSFGRHDVSRVQAHRDSAAAEGAEAMGAEAFASGDHVAFASGFSSLRTAAHEAAHVVQQRGRVQLLGGVGAENDEYERHADAVAELVVQGRSSEELLDVYDEEPATQRMVQRKEGDAPTEKEKRVAFRIVFDRPLTREQFINLAEITIFGRRVNGTWTGVKDKYKPADSPVVARVPASALQGRLNEYGESAGKVIQGIDQVQDAGSYQRLNTILQKLTPAQWADFEKRIVGKTTNLDDFEKAVDAYLSAQRQREAEGTARDRLVAKLYGLESLYQQYRNVQSQQGKEETLAAVAGTDLGAMGASPELIKMRDDLKANLIKAGFSGGIAEFEKFIQDYLIAFRTETVKIGFDILEQYDSVLYKENERYQDPAAVAALHAKLAPLRKEYAEIEKNEQAIQKALQSEPYRSAEERSRLPGQGGTTPPLPEEAKRAIEAGEGHKAAAKQSVQSISDEFPILKEEHLPLGRRLDKTAIAKADPAQLSALLKSHIQARRDDIKKTKETLATEPEKIFSLDNLLAASLQRQHVEPRSVFGQLVQDKVSAIKKGEVIVGFMIAVFAIALTIVSFGAAGIVAAGAAVGSFALSSVLAYQEYKEYETKHAAAGTGLLSDDPSLVWVIIAVGGAALDLGQATKAVKAISPLAKTLEATGDVAKFSEGLKALEKAGEIDAKIVRSTEQAALARAKSAKAVESLGQTLRSKVYGFPGPLADPDVYKDVVRLGYYKFKELGYDFLKFADEIRQARTAAKLGDLTNDELALLKKAYEEGKTFATEADLIKYMKRRPLGGKSIVVDENLLIARNKLAKGLPLQPGEQRMVDFLNRNPDAKLSVSEELYDKVAGKLDTTDLNIIESTAARGHADYEAAVKELETNKVGAAKGTEDRRLIADALFAKVESGTTPTFVTHDKGIYNRLLFMSGNDPAKLGKPVAEAFPNGFDVVINGRTLRVIPLPTK